MSAGTLRRAASLMRERATDARAGRWTAHSSQLTPDATLVVAEWDSPRRVAICSGSLPEGNAMNAEHIASWHPTIALGVSESLLQHAEIHDSYDCAHEPCAHIALAYAYLNEEPADA